MLSHINLFTYYSKIFGMVQHHKYTINDLENLIPYERDIYYDMLLEYLKKVEMEQKKAT